MADLLLKEEGDGGDIVLEGNSVKVINSFQNMPYLGMFGGNIEQSTIGPVQEGEQAFDWWGNWLLFSQQGQLQYNSTFERKIKEVALSSLGRVELERAAKFDIKFMEAFSAIVVDVSVESNDTIRIAIEINEPSNLQSTEIVYLWDSAKDELTIE